MPKMRKKVDNPNILNGSIKMLPLGGLGEIGKNMIVFESENDLIVIDSGLMFPLEDMLGIDLVLPDFSYVVEKAKKLKGIILTHGHEDHIGAVPYLLKKVTTPVYGTKLTLGLLKEKLEEMRLSADLKEISEKDRIKIGVFSIEFIPQIHSIPDGLALVIKTPFGNIIHTGDFKFDQTPLAGQRVYYERFAELAKEGVLLLLSDSTNAGVPGYTLPERLVSESLRNIFLKAKGRIIVASFASHIHRIQQIIDTAQDSGRFVAISGRSMHQSVRVSIETGHLKVDNRTLIDMHKMKTLPGNKVCILSTGSQGEPMSALSLMASGEHKHVKVGEGDTVIIAASPIPGNERSVTNIIDRLMKNKANVIYEKTYNVHVSGHASQEELKLMINLVSPKYFVPIHGEYRHLKYHADIANSVGIPGERIFVLENGETLEIDSAGIRKSEKVRAGVIFVDGLGIGDIKDVVLRDRKHLSQDGIIILVIAINQLTGEIIHGPDIISRGVTYKEEELHVEAQKRVISKINRIALEDGITDLNVIKNDVKSTLSSFIYEKTRRRPMVMPLIIEV